jgi:hypothetical protein
MSIPDYSGNPTYRLSNAERDRAVTELRQHVAEGRLTEAEFAERSKAARNAVTRGDLAPLFDDLPATTFPASVSDTARPTQAAAPTVFADAPADAPTDDVLPAYGAPDIRPDTQRLASPAASPAIVPSTPGATEGWQNPQSRQPSRIGATVMAIVPFVSLTLFFVTGSVFSFGYSWLWFALIPVAGVIVYGPNGRPKR